MRSGCQALVNKPRYDCPYAWEFGCRTYLFNSDHTQHLALYMVSLFLEFRFFSPLSVGWPLQDGGTFDTIAHEGAISPQCCFPSVVPGRGAWMYFDWILKVCVSSSSSLEWQGEMEFLRDRPMDVRLERQSEDVRTGFCVRLTAYLVYLWKDGGLGL